MPRTTERGGASCGVNESVNKTEENSPASLKKGGCFEIHGSVRGSLRGSEIIHVELVIIMRTPAAAAVPRVLLFLFLYTRIRRSRGEERSGEPTSPSIPRNRDLLMAGNRGK